MCYIITHLRYHAKYRGQIIPWGYGMHNSNQSIKQRAEILLRQHFSIISDFLSTRISSSGFELVTIWSEKMVQSSYEMTEIENAPSLDAENWQLFPVLLPNL